ncbi:NADH-quinone oxidoreductase subunit K [Roseisolibacter sp. H3M3-2]|uniref:sodium:proton antiporter n=1 Tax=Roseisolibacter sp. H3M3-2 TaxID=3031323 RepID=UPI0023DC263E|nr:NADH-quinone oxidoreductase subunit K [Roseisolibacter sp. H3M3-2]MDF1501388.1 NADH-quinone oxidoreductase subunit K [Roseisolibacter sp. H3M3-2]
MSVLLALAAAGLAGCGLYMILSRHVVRMVLGLSLLGTAVNLMLFQAGRVRTAQPPLIREGAVRLGESADPVPQALVLTAIVIGFALTVILAALALRAFRGEGTLRSDELRAARALGDPLAPEPGRDR